MRSPGNFNPEWGYLAPAPSFMRTARAVLVATAVGATAGVAVVISLIDRPAEDGSKTTPVAAHPVVTSVQAAAPMEPSASTVAASAVAPVAAVSKPASRAAAPVALAPAAALIAAAKVAAPAAAPPAAIEMPTAAPAQPSTPQIMAPEAIPQIAPKVAIQPLPAATAHAAETPAPTKDADEAPAEGAHAGEANTAPPPKPAAGIAALSARAPTTGAVRTDAPDQALIPPQSVPPEKKTRHHFASSYTHEGGINGMLQRVFGRRHGTSYYPDH